MSDTMEIAVLAQPLNPVAIFNGGVDAVIASIEARAREEKRDISTPSGRKAMTSFAFKIARSKTALDDAGKSLVEGLKKQTGAIDRDRKTIRDRLDELKADFLAPLTEWEAEEEARIAAHEEALLALMAPPELENEPSEKLQAFLDGLNSPDDRDWQMFKQRATDLRKMETEKVKRWLDFALKREQTAREQEEARLAAVEAERVAAAKAQAIREARIAEEAAQQAKEAAEREAQAQMAEALRQHQAEQEKAKRAQEAQEQAAATAAQKAARDLEAAEKRAETERAEAAQRELAAIAAERTRLFNEAEAEKKAERDRAADKAHKGGIHRDAMTDLMAAVGLSEITAKAVVVAIATGKVRHVKVSY